MANQEMKTKTLAQWFGSDRLIATEIGRELDGLAWIGIPFAGGLSIVPLLSARSIVANDLHGAMMNMGSVAKDPVLGPRLFRALRRELFHPAALRAAQSYCLEREATGPAFDPACPDFAWAKNYFVAVWMGRGGDAGTKVEFNGALSFRWDAGGGDSNTRFRSATAGLLAWRHALSACNFVSMDALEFVRKCKDAPGHGLYVDSPFPGPGDRYRHTFGEPQLRALARELGRFGQTRLCIRYYEHELIRELYPEGDTWEWRRLVGRKRSNNDAPEVLILNQPSRAGNAEASEASGELLILNGASRGGAH